MKNELEKHYRDADQEFDPLFEVTSADGLDEEWDNNQRATRCVAN